MPSERLVAVRPLDLGAAIELFETRTEVHQGGFVLDTAQAAVVEELCQRLDGLPLAIELAAARARTMPLADLAARLDERFRLLRGQQHATERHQTLRTMVAWSYELLTAEERRLFDRLSVFVGGFNLAAAEQVCSGDDFDAIEVDDLIGSLTDKSLIAPGPGGRYVLLETLRQYGEEQLAAGDSPTRFRGAHLACFVPFAAAVHVGLLGSDEVDWWARLQADWLRDTRTTRRHRHSLAT